MADDVVLQMGQYRGFAVVTGPFWAGIKSALEQAALLYGVRLKVHQRGLFVKEVAYEVIGWESQVRAFQSAVADAVQERNRRIPGGA